MIDAKDWKKFTAQLKLKEEIERGQVYAGTITVQNVDKVFGALASKSLAYRMIGTSFEHTVEGCLNWIVAGRPTIAKKLKVKRD